MHLVFFATIPYLFSLILHSLLSIRISECVFVLYAYLVVLNSFILNYFNRDKRLWLHSEASLSAKEKQSIRATMVALKRVIFPLNEPKGAGCTISYTFVNSGYL